MKITERNIRAMARDRFEFCDRASTEHHPVCQDSQVRWVVSSDRFIDSPIPMPCHFHWLWRSDVAEVMFRPLPAPVSEPYLFLGIVRIVRDQDLHIARRRFDERRRGSTLRKVATVTRRNKNEDSHCRELAAGQAGLRKISRSAVHTVETSASIRLSADGRFTPRSPML